jgi:hypothetical protein
MLRRFCSLCSPTGISRNLRVFLGVFIASALSLEMKAQDSKYDEQSILGLQAMMRNRGMQIEFTESASVDVFQLSKKLLEYTPIDCYRLTSEDRKLTIESDRKVHVVIKSREWMKATLDKQFECEPILKDFALQIVLSDREQFEIAPDKLEMSKHAKK